jgi:hypothetical protein
MRRIEPDRRAARGLIEKPRSLHLREPSRSADATPFIFFDPSLACFAHVGVSGNETPQRQSTRGDPTMLDMQWVKQRFESTRKATKDDSDSDTGAHQLKRVHPLSVYIQPKIGDRPSIRIGTGCGACIPAFTHI